MTAQMFVGLLVEGAILAVPLILIAFLLSRFIRDIIGRSLLVVFLFAAAGAYFGFALLAAPGPIWVLAELVQVIIFGAIALLGLRGSPWWRRYSPARSARLSMVACCGVGTASPVGRGASLRESGTLIRTDNLHHPMPQL